MLCAPGQRSDHRRCRRICFYLIDSFVSDWRLANLLKILVVLICACRVLRSASVLGLGGCFWSMIPKSMAYFSDTIMPADKSSSEITKPSSDRFSL